MDGGASYNPRTVEEVFRDFKGRRAGMIKALTAGTSFCFFYFFELSFLYKKIRYEILGELFNLVSFLWFVADVEEFYQQCDPGSCFLFNFIF
jgi:hypothetical protein